LPPIDIETTADGAVLRGRRLVRAGLALAVMGAFALAMTPLFFGIPPVTAVLRWVIVALLALTMERGRGWARWGLGVFVLFGTLASLAGALAALRVGWAVAWFAGCGTAYLAGYLVALLPADARAYLAARGRAPVPT
jgi:hypothetical protein